MFWRKGDGGGDVWDDGGGDMQWVGHIYREFLHLFHFAAVANLGGGRDQNISRKKRFVCCKGPGEVVYALRLILALPE